LQSSFKRLLFTKKGASGRWKEKVFCNNYEDAKDETDRELGMSTLDRDPDDFQNREVSLIEQEIGKNAIEHEDGSSAKRKRGLSMTCDRIFNLPIRKSSQWL
jgi:hypothetical protein